MTNLEKDRIATCCECGKKYETTQPFTTKEKDICGACKGFVPREEK